MLAINEILGSELAHWDDMVVANPDGGHFLQSAAWGDFKGLHHWKPRRFKVELKDGTSLAAQFLTRGVPGMGEVWYCPKGPGVISAVQAVEVAKMVQTVSPDGFALRLEPELVEEAGAEAKLARLGWHRSRHQILKATIKVDLGPAEDQILANFKQKTRYNVRLAAKKGVVVEAVEANADNFRTMYGLMSTTQSRAGFFLHNYEYFAGYWAGLAAMGQGQLFFARHDGQTLAGVFAIRLGQKVWYKDGGSIREKRELMAPYLLQWEVMRWAKAAGATSYDMWGAPPKHEQGHIMDSLLQFKMGFDPNIIEFIGTFDVPLKTRQFNLWVKGGERLVGAYSSRVKKEFWY